MRLGAAIYATPLAVGICALAVGLISGQTGLPSQPTVTLRTTTTLIQVNVVAHDKNGHVIDDLRKDEFEIFDSGKPQTLRDEHRKLDRDALYEVDVDVEYVGFR